MSIKSNTNKPATTLNTTATNSKDMQAQILAPVIETEDSFIDAFVDKEPDAKVLADYVFSKDKLLNDRLIKALAILHDSNPLDSVILGSAQTQFYHCLVKGIINENETEASYFLTEVLRFVEANLDRMFSPRKIFRGVNKMPTIPLTQHEEFQVLLRILVDTAIPETRIKNARIMNWTQIEANIKTEHKLLMLERLQNFYHI